MVMMATTSAPPIAADPTLAQRCRELGLSLLSVDATGNLLDRAAAADAPLERALIGCEVFAACLRREANRWAGQEKPEPGEAWPGCQLIPVPVRRRRRRVGYQVALLLTAELAEGEHLHRLCDIARLDHRTVAQRLARAPGRHPAEIARLAAMLNWMTDDLHRAARGKAELDSLSSQLGVTYEELGLVYELSDHMTVRRDPRAFLQQACEELHQVVGLRWLALQLTDDDPRLQGLRGETTVAGRDAPRDRSVIRSIGRALLQRFSTPEPAIIDDTRALGIKPLADATRRALIVPVVVEDRPIAMMVAADKADGSDLSSIDAKLVHATAQHLAVFLENTMLYEDVQDTFTSALRSLVSAIDAKDTYTCGHSERVAWLSRRLAEACGLDARTTERVYLSALVHDVGKIGVPEAVLCKPGRLSDNEFAMIRAHPGIGARILRGIRQMEDLLPGVLHHHERFDGRGYPDRLAGRDIPLFGRLICLADSFDAMSSNRTYRNAMPQDRVLDEVRQCAATQFDPDLAEVFLSLDFTPYKRMVVEHQRRDTPLALTMRRNSA